MLCRSRQSSSAAEGGEVFDLYNKIGYEFWSLFEFLKNELPKDVIVYIIMHDETDDYGNTKLKMLGRLLEQKVCVEGMVTICLRCVSDEKGHFFITNSKTTKQFGLERIEWLSGDGVINFRTRSSKGGLGEGYDLLIIDEAIIFPANNKAAGCEVRAVLYLHWWTFLGYFGEIVEGLFSTIMSIRHKRAEGKKA